MLKSLGLAPGHCDPSLRTRWVMLRGHAAWRERVAELAVTPLRRYQDGDRIPLELDAPAATIVPAEHPHECFTEQQP